MSVFSVPEKRARQVGLAISLFSVAHLLLLFEVIVSAFKSILLTCHRKCKNVSECFLHVFCICFSYKCTTEKSEGVRKHKGRDSEGRKMSPSNMFTRRNVKDC